MHWLDEWPSITPYMRCSNNLFTVWALLMIKSEYVGRIILIPQLLMSWHSWYWPCMISKLFSSHDEGFKRPLLFHCWEVIKMQMHLYVFCYKFNTTVLNLNAAETNKAQHLLKVTYMYQFLTQPTKFTCAVDGNCINSWIMVKAYGDVQTITPAWAIIITFPLRLSAYLKVW